MAVELVDIEQGVLAGGLWHLKSKMVDDEEILYLRHKVAFSRHKEFRLGGNQLSDLLMVTDTEKKKAPKNKLRISFIVKELGQVNAVVGDAVYLKLEKMITANKPAPEFKRENTPMLQVVGISAVILAIGFISQYFQG
jgi:hypothetical protein